MATVYQASAGAANANKITISMWCRAHSTNPPSDAGEWYSLLEFGYPNGVFDSEGAGASNYMLLRTNSTDTNNNVLAMQIGGVLDSVAAADVITHSSGPFELGDLSYTNWTSNPFFPSISDPFLYDETRSFTPYVPLTSTNLGASLALGNWFHLLIAIDTSNESTYADPFGNNRVFAMINGSVAALKGEWDDAARPALTNGKFIPSMASRNDSQFFKRGPYEWVGRNGGLAHGKIPPFDLDLNGTEIAIPSQIASTNKNTQLLDMADVQIWVGQYIDPTDPANFEKFVSISGGRGFPASPYGAAIAFGPQTYLFTGNSSTFYDNQGTGGVFSKSGTLSNISGPSY
jgi:hypothetical protein